MEITAELVGGTSTIYNDRGRTAIPKKIREEMGWEKGEELEMIVVNNRLEIVSKRDRERMEMVEEVIEEIEGDELDRETVEEVVRAKQEA